MKLDYDQSADVLYITFASSISAAKYVETERGSILRVNQKTGKILSCTIPMFSRLANSGEVDVPEMGGVEATEKLAKLLRRITPKKKAKTFKAH